MTDKPKSIYDMKLHDTVYIYDGLEAFRVSNGWIYHKYKYFDQYNKSLLTSVLVPYSEEFKKKDKS